MDPVRISLEIDPEAEPIAGWVLRGDHEPRRFAGLLELIALIDAGRRPRGSDGVSDGDGSAKAQ